MNCGCKLLGSKKTAGLPAKLEPRFLRGLAPADLNVILSAASHRQFLASSVILHHGDPAERIFLLTSGLGRHFVLTGDGRKVLLYWLTAGQVFGGMTMLSGSVSYLASTELLSDGCALVWDKKTIRELVSRYPILLDNALSIAGTENFAWLVGAYVSLSSDNAAGRVAHMLISLACGVGREGPNGIEIRVGNEDLAAAANVTPFTVSRALSAWQREGVVTKGRGRIFLRKPGLLATG
jgi:CRP/FNR family transcriptional regulator, nitrogen oxide reductase regulator